jgi:hypothetical protein
MFIYSGQLTKYYRSNPFQYQGDKISFLSFHLIIAIPERYPSDNQEALLCLQTSKYSEIIVQSLNILKIIVTNIICAKGMGQVKLCESPGKAGGLPI